jgi:hypothetical protein
MERLKFEFNLRICFGFADFLFGLKFEFNLRIFLLDSLALFFTKRGFVLTRVRLSMETDTIMNEEYYYSAILDF